MPDGKAKRDYDARPIKVRKLIDDLLSLGVVPRVVEIDGLHIEVGSYVPPRQAGNNNGGALAEAERQAQAPENRPRSHRQQARDEFRRRRREVEP